MVPLSASRGGTINVIDSVCFLRLAMIIEMIIEMIGVNETLRAKLPITAYHEGFIVPRAPAHAKLPC